MILSVNGMAVAVETDAPAEFAAARELLRQRAVTIGLLDPVAEDEAAIEAAIEALLEREVATPVPNEAECRRYYEQNPAEFESGDLVLARHILFQVTPQVNAAGLINLKINPEVSSRAGETSFGGASGAQIPIIATRRTSTQVAISAVR